MPRRVNTAERRLAITTAAVRILARGGPSALTLRSLAEELDGSITLITHFFANRDDLFAAIIDDIDAMYTMSLAEIDRDADPVERLRALLRWLVPLTDDEREQEAGRLALITMRDDAVIKEFFDLNERRVRQLLSDHLEPILPAAEVADAVDLLRATTNGIILSAVEHPDLWTPSRQLRVIESALSAIGVHARA